MAQIIDYRRFSATFRRADAAAVAVPILTMMTAMRISVSSRISPSLPFRSRLVNTPLISTASSALMSTSRNRTLISPLSLLSASSLSLSSSRTSSRCCCYSSLTTLNCSFHHRQLKSATHHRDPSLSPLRRLTSCNNRSRDHFSTSTTSNNTTITTDEDDDADRSRPRQQEPQQHQKKQKQRSDPFARRPTSKCDPYGQGGKPMTLEQAQSLMRTIDESQWEIVMKDDEDESNNVNDRNDGDRDETASSSVEVIPFALSRTFRHGDYIMATKFLQAVAAVCEMNNHYAYRLELYRVHNTKSKTWDVTTKVMLRTTVLGGLSSHDFMIAALLDVECDRPEVQRLLIQ